MNKTLIALAIAAALPVAAQADATISGTLTSKYKNTGAIDTDARLSVASSEVLANGMTATAAFVILADHDDDTENQGTATLTGDFGALTVGEIDADGAFQAGDVGGAVSDTTESTDGTTSTVFGIHYAGSVAGLTVAVQVNANTGATGSGAVTAATANGAAANYAKKTDTTKTKGTQMSATYEVNGLSLGYAYASADATNANNANTGHDGVHEGQTAVGAAYAFGDLVVSVGKQNLKDTDPSPDALVSATYTMAIDAVTIKAQVDNTPSGDYQVNMSYALSDALSFSSEIDKGKTTTLVATYTAGNMTATVARQDDDTTDASISLDYGNADLTIGRVGARAGDASVGRDDDEAEYSHVTYKVAF
jgi:hypothetical protein